VAEVMLKIKNHAPTFILTVTITAIASSPPAPRQSVENTKQLQGTLSLDRDTYFPGEVALFTVTVRNPESGLLEIPEPFSSVNGCFALRKLLEGGVALPLSAQPICPSRVAETSTQATAILGPSEQRQAILSSETLMSAMDAPAPPVLNRPGYYQLEYLYYYLHPSAVFRVVTPHLDASTVVQLQDVTYTDPNTGRNVRLPAYLHVLALRWNNQSYICVSQFPGSTAQAVSADAHGDFSGSDFPYVRIATSPEAVKSMNATVDAHDRLTVLWLDAAGHWQGQSVGASLAEPRPGTVQIGLDSTFEKVMPAGSRQFTATVIGSTDAALKWSVALAPGAPARAAAGVVNASGKYSAPANVTRAYQVILRARLQNDAARSAIAVLNLAPPKAMTQVYTGGAARSAEER
jgi:hypothetical protein